jgi:hypothetical protein
MEVLSQDALSLQPPNSIHKRLSARYVATR